MKALLLAVAGVATLAQAQDFLPDLQLAQGPSVGVERARAAAAKCRAPVRFENIEADQSVMFLLDGGRNRQRYNCLSRWIARQPETGFQKYGFIGREGFER